MGILFENDWTEIVEEMGQYFIRYNSGDLVNSKKEILVSKEDANLAQKSEKDETDVIIKYQNLYNKIGGSDRTIIHENDWLKIYYIGGKYILRYNKNKTDENFKEVEISLEEMYAAREGDDGAYNVIEKHKNF